MSWHSAQHGRRRAVRGVAAVAGAAIAVAVVAGCASRSGLAARSDKSAGGAIQFAAVKVVAAKSVHVHGTVSGVASGDATGTIDGAIVFAPTLQGELTMKLDHDAEMVPTHILYDGKTLYSSIPKGFGATSKAKPNATWFAVDMTTLVPKESPVLSALKSDPAALVKVLLAKGKFTQALTDTADGIAATHFTGDLSGDDAGHVDVWLDGSGLPIEVVFQTAANKTDKQSPARTDLHFSQWGKSVTITPPPADQVLTEQDQISFAISGQQFKVSGGQPTGSTSGLGGLGEVATIGGGSNDSGQAICIPVNGLPSGAQPAPTSTCITVILKPTPTHS